MENLQIFWKVLARLDIVSHLVLKVPQPQRVTFTVDQ